MGKQIYEKPAMGLLKDMLAAWNLQPGQVFTAARAVEWFGANYPKLRAVTVRRHLTRAATNDKNRLHHSPAEADDLLFKVGPGRQFRLYQPGIDPAPIREMVLGDVARQELESPDEDDLEDGADEGQPGSSQFLWERDLQLYLSKNLECIEAGLRLYDDSDQGGLEYDAGGRRIDILAIDRKGNFVVIELKVSRGYDRVIGQLLRYMNWVRKELAEPGQKVRGVIICRAMSEDLRLACASMPDVALYEYKLSVAVSRVEPLVLPSQ